jgi:hypothetical protein
MVAVDDVGAELPGGAQKLRWGNIAMFYRYHQILMISPLTFKGISVYAMKMRITRQVCDV